MNTQRTLKKTILTAVTPLLLALPISAVAKNITISITDATGETSLLPNHIEPTYYTVDQYADLRVRCSNFVTELKMHKRTAQLKLSQGKVPMAAQILNDYIQKRAGEIGTSFYFRANPHTIVAFVEASKVLRVSFTEAEKFRAVLKWNTDMLKLKMAEEMTNLIISTYENLDAPYFFNAIDQCRSYGCYGQSGAGLSFLHPQYYQNLAEVSKSFINSYLQNKQFMAFEPIELSIASQVAVSAAEALSTSLDRRSFACPATRLIDINKWINSELATDMSYENLIVVTEETRNQMRWALGEIYSAQCPYVQYHR